MNLKKHPENPSPLDPGPRNLDGFLREDSGAENASENPAPLSEFRPSHGGHGSVIHSPEGVPESGKVSEDHQGEIRSSEKSAGSSRKRRSRAGKKGSLQASGPSPEQGAESPGGASAAGAPALALVEPSPRSAESPSPSRAVAKKPQRRASPSPQRSEIRGPRSASEHQETMDERTSGKTGSHRKGRKRDTPPKAPSPEKKSPPEKKVLKRLLIDAMDPEELRIAVLEGDSLEELYFERSEEKKYLGNIYKGRVINLEPAIQAAFVEIGIGRNGFLHVSDVLPVYAGATAIPIDSLSRRSPGRRRMRIQELLHNGQELLVQITKDSIGAKGPSLTTYISIPGKYLVLMPGVSRFGVSKRIQDGVERAKLRASLTSLDPPKGLGYIVRTAGKDEPREVLEKDLNHLVKIWKTIGERVKSYPASSLIYEESDLLTRALRDLCGPDVDEISVNEEGAFHRVKEFLGEVMPQSERVARHYTGTIPLFSKYGVEDEIERIYNRRVTLPSGGYLIIEQTEALVSIDVNSGKFTEEKDLEDTALKTNLEAAVEIARQLRLRDLGGVIVNDFIDMVHEENRREVERAFKAALKRDRAKCWVSRISRFGIIEMTRQRMRPSLERTMYEPCKHCGGTGIVRSPRSVGATVLRQLQVELATRKKDLAEVVVYPQVQNYLLNHKRKQISSMEQYFRKSIVILGDPDCPPDQYTIDFK